VNSSLPPAPPIQVGAPPRRRPRALDALIEIATTVALAVILYVVIQSFVVQTFRVEQQSMVPTLQEQEHLLIDKLTPRFDDYSRGDIIVFHPPDRGPGATPFIKRVIGVAGDAIELRDGTVWVNGVELEESYTAPGSETLPTDGTDTWEVAAGELFAMGDNREHSVDSRRFGVVPVGNVVGRAWLRFWPIDTLNLFQTPTYPTVPAAP